MFAQLKPQIDSLVQMAAGGSDAVAAADLLFDNVITAIDDDAIYDRLFNVINGPNFVNQAAVFNPGVKQHEAWFKTFQAQVVKRYDEEDAAVGQQPSAG